MAEDGAAVCYIFDLVAVSPGDRPQMVAVLAALLQAAGVRKVLHDGRRDAEALLYQLEISIAAPVLDTQVTCLSHTPHCAVCILNIQMDAAYSAIHDRILPC